MPVSAENAVLLGMWALIITLLLILAVLWAVYFRANRQGAKIIEHDARIKGVEDDTPKAKVRELHRMGKRNGTHG